VVREAHRFSIKGAAECRYTTKHLRYHEWDRDGLQPEKGQGEPLPSTRRERKHTYIEKTASEAQYTIGYGEC
jgi:hypothetical protein